jgi:hypothetical protein
VYALQMLSRRHVLALVGGCPTYPALLRRAGAAVAREAGAAHAWAHALTIAWFTAASGALLLAGWPRGLGTAGPGATDLFLVFKLAPVYGLQLLPVVAYAHALAAVVATSRVRRHLLRLTRPATCGSPVLGCAADLVRSRSELVAENALLRRQPCSSGLSSPSSWLSSARAAWCTSA